METNQNRRRTRRFETNCQVRFAKMIMGMSSLPLNDGQTIDLSHLGAGIQTHGEYKAGDILKMNLSVPGWEKYKNEFIKLNQPTNRQPLVVLGEVKWTSKEGNLTNIGMDFVGIDQDHQAALKKFLDNSMATEAA